MQTIMDVRTLSVLLVVIIHLVTAAWKDSQEDRRAGRRKGLHYHTKRHMMPTGVSGSEPKRRITTLKPREMRKKPSGHLKPLDEDDMENDEVVSVAVGPPPIRPKYDKVHWKHSPKKNSTSHSNSSATELVRNVLTQLGREFLTHQVNEDFVFGQYVGNAMRNLTSELRLNMQHDILEIIVRYQRMNRGEIKTDIITERSFVPTLKDVMKAEKRAVNDTDDTNWPDFSNLAKIVG